MALNTGTTVPNRQERRRPKKRDELTPPAPSADMYTVEEAAYRLRVSVKTVWRLRNRGELPVVEISPGVIRFRRADVEALIERRTRHRVSDLAPRIFDTRTNILRADQRSTTNFCGTGLRRVHD